MAEAADRAEKSSVRDVREPKRPSAPAGIGLDPVAIPGAPMGLLHSYPADPTNRGVRQAGVVRLGGRAGNAALARTLAPSPQGEMVQRLFGSGLTERQKIDKALEAKTDSGLVKDIDDFSKADREECLTLAQILVTNYTAFFGPRDRSCLKRIFESMGEDMNYVATKKPFLLEKCLKEWPGLMMEIKPIKKAADDFRNAIGAEAKKNLQANIEYLKKERKTMFGEETPDPAKNLASSEEQKQRAAAMIVVAEKLLKIRKKQKEMLDRKVGFKYVHGLGSGVEHQNFKPGAPPENNNQEGLQYSDLLEIWTAAAEETGRQASKYPWLFGILKDPDSAEARLQALIDKKGDPYAARTQIMDEMQKQIQKAEGVLAQYTAKEPDWYDLQPVREKLFDKNLNGNFERIVARQVVASRDDSEYWKKVGLESATMVALLVATFATAGAAPVVAGLIAGAVAVGIPAAQAYAAFEKAHEMENANRATVVPGDDLVSQMQIDAERAEGVAKTIEGVLNALFIGAEGAGAVKLELKLARVGELAAAEQKAVLSQAIVNARYGVIGTAERTGMSLPEIMSKVGADTDAGRAVSKTTAELLEKPVGELTAAERNALKAVRREGGLGAAGAERASLDDPAVVARLGGASEELIRTWTGFSGAEARLAWARNTIRQLLKDAGCEVEIEVAMKPKPRGQWGSFQPSTWTITLNENELGNEATAHTISEVMKTIHHEARHAEQYYLMARRLYGKGWIAPQIDTALGLRADIIASARRAGPIADKDSQAAAIDVWLKDFETADARAHRNWFLTEKDKWRDSWKQLAKDFEEASDPDLLAPKARRDALESKMNQAKGMYDQFQKMYKESGVEADAYRVEALVKVDLKTVAAAKTRFDALLAKWEAKWARAEAALDTARKAGQPQVSITMRERDVAEAKEMIAKIKSTPTIAE